MPEGEQIDVKKLEQEARALAAEIEKMSAEADKMMKSDAAVREELDANPLDTKAMDEQALEDFT